MSSLLGRRLAQNPLLHSFQGSQRCLRARRHQSPPQSTPGPPADADADALYHLLGLSKTAAHSDIRRAYRDLAAKLHPDVAADSSDASRFQAVSLAYQVLSNADLRHQYDLHGVKALGPTYTFLRDYLGVGGDKLHQARRGDDVFTVLGLSLQEAVTGVQKEVQFAAMASCTGCQGTGLKGGSQVTSSEDCGVCRGLGEIIRSRWSPQGRLPLVAACPACGGQGISSRAYCVKCSGEGRARVRRRVEVKVPAGLDTNAVLKVDGHGNCGWWGGESGDLYIRMQVYNDEQVERRGVHLYSNLQVGVVDAILGVSMDVRTYRGDRLLDIPPGTQHGDQLMVRGAGVPSSSGGLVQYGHHYFQVEVVVPDGKVLSSNQVQLLQRLRGMQPSAF